jgi:uncharacterized SAM-binding protein YcdF (DUF218 family)
MKTGTADQAPRKFLGLLTQKKRWGLSWRGAALLAVIILLGAWLLLLGIHPFLAVTHREDTKILVMEGWVHEFAAQAAAEEFKTGAYEKIYVTGVPVAGSGAYTIDSNTEAYVGAGLLKRHGMSEEFLQRVPRRAVERDRTYGSAIELRNWFREHNVLVQSINIVTEGVHARRTRLLFQEAFGKSVVVGIIAAPNPEYDARHWWRYSTGVREVVGETIAYIYARFLYYPSESQQVSNDKDSQNS